MRKLLLTAVVAVVLAIPSRLADARPATTLLNDLRADLAGRAAALQGSADPGDIAKLIALKSSIKAIDKDESRSILDDLGTLKKVAAKIEFVYGANDPALVTAFNGFLNTFTTTIAGVALQLEPGLFATPAQQEISKIVNDAGAALIPIQMPPSDQNTIKLRAGALREVGKAAALAVSKARKAAKALCKHNGTYRATLDDGTGARPFAPPFCSGSWTYSGSRSGPLVAVSMTAYYYDKKAPPGDSYAPYHKGYVSFDWVDGGFSGPGVYTIGGGGKPVYGTYYYEGNFYSGMSGTLTVTSYDEATKDIQGTFSGTFETFSGPAPVTFTNGGFRLCEWRDLVQTP